MRHWLGIIAIATVGALLPVRMLATPVIQHWTTSNGMRVYFVPAPELPMVDLRLVFDAGSARDGDLAGLARMTFGLLDEGAGDWDADEIADRFEQVGAQYWASADRDMASISLRSLTDPQYLEPALETFLQVISAPTFEKRALERARKLMLVSLQNQAQQPGEIAKKAFYRAVYGDHPFASPISGTEQSLEMITGDDVRAFHRRYVVSRNAVLAIVGDLDREGAERIAERTSKSLPEGEAPTSLPDVKLLTESKTVRVPFPSKQAHVYIGQPGMRRGDPDYFSLYVGNHVLGGSGFSSRLVKEVRVSRGLSYSVYSYFIPQVVEGPFQLGLQTRVDQADEAVTIARQTIQEFIKNGPSEVELEESVKNITGGFPLRIDSNRDVVNYLAVIGFYGLPLDYLEQFNEQVSAVTVDAIQEAFKRRLNVNHMVTVIVGGEQKDN